MKVRIIEKFSESVNTKYARFLVQYRKWFVWRTYNYFAYNLADPKDREHALQYAQELLAELKQKIQSTRLPPKVILIEDTNDTDK